MTGVCLCPLIRFDWLLIAQDITDSDMGTCASSHRDREAETQPALPGQRGAAFQPGPGARPELQHKTAAEISVSLSRLLRISRPGDSHGLPGDKIPPDPGLEQEHWGQECAILWYSVVTKRIQAVHDCTHTW